ncbi:LuxR C-terminal-related transcriptional regulator [Adlercreutzia sp. R25]|uniref:response regulator transcription factor n=1 Tax=Adlercreutzia shanghongiae TaxID=3111773 RepID=UPI002DBDC8CC|nr:LuxR C-terminal-related transcriptional regulator [Adlercreutzia sp. R25]MEC4271927.1 LuxR C-terminal-related transcriptional regulator [Adlercreutzia sp. R25]
MNLDTSFRGGRVPSLGIVGAGLWIAWITLIYSTDLSLGESGASQQSTASAFVYSTLALGVTLMVLSFVPDWTRRHLLAPRPLAISSCIAAAMTLVVLNGSSVPALPIAACAAATGCMTALVALRLAIVFSEVESRSMLMGMGAALLLGVLVYSFATMLVLCGLVIPAAVILVLLIPLAVFTLNLEDPAAALAEESASFDQATPSLSATLVRLAVFAAMSLFLLSLTRGYYPSLIEPSAFAVSRCIVALGLVLVGLLVIVAAWASPRDAAFGTLCYWLLITAVLVVLVLALVNVDATVMGDVSSVLFGVTCICLWALLCRMSFRSGVDAVRVVGLGFGAACLGTTAGVGVGALIYDMGMPEGLLSFVMAAAIILCVAGSLFLLRRDDIVRLMEPADSRSSSAEEGLDAGIGIAEGESRNGGAPIEAATGADALDGYQASLQRLCAIMGIDYGLSSREVDVLELLVLGKDAKAIADALFISFNTVRSHIRRIYGKLDVHSRQELLDLVREQAE